MRPTWLQGEAQEIRDTLFAEKTYQVAYEAERCARTHRWKYIRRFADEHPTPVLANVDDSLSKDVVLSNGWAERPVPTEQLYDLLHDPNEANNLGPESLPSHTSSTICARLETWMRETEDSLLNDPIPAPKAPK